jgi:hypothetical protein
MIEGAIRVELVPQMGPPYRGDAAVFEGLELACGTGAVCCQAARVLQAMGRTGRVEFWRGDTLCLAGSLSVFAKLTVKEGDRLPSFAPYLPFEGWAERPGEPAGALFSVAPTDVALRGARDD